MDADEFSDQLGPYRGAIDRDPIVTRGIRPEQYEGCAILATSCIRMCRYALIMFFLATSHRHLYAYRSHDPTARPHILGHRSIVVPRDPPENLLGNARSSHDPIDGRTHHLSDLKRFRFHPLSLSLMKHRILLSLTLASIGTIAVPAFAQTAPTTQPDNGFYQGPDPEWSTLHSNDVRGTPVHREYHRDAVRTHLQWHSDTQLDRNTGAYSNTHRIRHQERNMAHRHFHTDPEDFDVSTNSNGSGSNGFTKHPLYP